MTEHCGGWVKVIANIEDSAVIAHILKHLKQKNALAATAQQHALPQESSPPQTELFELPF